MFAIAYSAESMINTVLANNVTTFQQNRLAINLYRHKVERAIFIEILHLQEICLIEALGYHLLHYLILNLLIHLHT